jgi:hypothetical protein
LRIEFSCVTTKDSIALQIGEHQGTFHPWWDRIHVEVYGWDSEQGTVTLKSGSSIPNSAVDSTRHVLSVDVPDSTRGDVLIIRSSN